MFRAPRKANVSGQASRYVRFTAPLVKRRTRRHRSNADSRCPGLPTVVLSLARCRLSAETCHSHLGERPRTLDQKPSFASSERGAAPSFDMRHRVGNPAAEPPCWSACWGPEAVRPIHVEMANRVGLPTRFPDVFGSAHRLIAGGSPTCGWLRAFLPLGQSLIRAPLARTPTCGCLAPHHRRCRPARQQTSSAVSIGPIMPHLDFFEHRRPKGRRGIFGVGVPNDPRPSARPTVPRRRFAGSEIVDRAVLSLKDAGGPSFLIE
jgi:hypothetical protein